MRYASPTFLRSVAIFGAAFAFGAGTATAGVLVTSPPGDGVDGNGMGVRPFTSDNDANGNRFQQVFSADFFRPVGDLQSIMSVAFRPRQGAIGFIQNSVTFSDLTVRLSTTPRNANTDSPNGLNADLDTNVGVDETTVFSGPITFTTDRGFFDTDVEDFDFVIPFDTPFLFQPDAGNLLLEVLVPAGVEASNRFTQLASFTDGFPSMDGVASANDADLTDGLSVGSNSTTGVVAQFEVQAVDNPGAVPEPSTAFAFATMLVATTLQIRRRKPFPENDAATTRA